MKAFIFSFYGKKVIILAKDVDQACETFYEEYPDVQYDYECPRVDYEEVDTSEPRIFRLT